MNDWLEAKNILAVRTDSIGNTILLGPALRAIKETLPQARLTLLTSPEGATAVGMLPWIDEVIAWNAVWQDSDARMPFGPDRERHLISLLADYAFDAALLFTTFGQTPHAPAYACYLAGIPLRAGESKEHGGGTLTHELHSAPPELHQVERNLLMVEQLGFKVRERHPTLALSQRNRDSANSLLRTRGIDPARPFILIHPGSSVQARRYPAKRFAAVVTLLTNHGWQVLLTGLEHEEELLIEVAHTTPTTRYIAGEMTVAEYAALIERASLVICNNSLPLHLADALHTPLLVMYSGRDAETQWQPRTTSARLLRRSTACHPCALSTCPIDLMCLDIPAEQVAEAAEALLEMHKQGQGAGGDSERRFL